MKMTQLREYARIGAEIRLAKLTEEIRQLLKALPGETDQVSTTRFVDRSVTNEMSRIAARPDRAQIHWTKRPENAAKLAAMTRKSARTRRANKAGKV